MLACSEPKPRAAAEGPEPSDMARPGATASDPGLRVEFEELALDGEPAFITDFAFYPGSATDFLALDKSGRLLRFRLHEQSATLLATAQVDGVYDSSDCGALSLAFEPDLASHAYVYVGTCVSAQQSKVVRLDLDDEQNVVDDSQVSIFQAGSAKAERPWHNVGSIGFEPDGVMGAMFGDKALAGAAQDPSENLGKLVRIVPSREPGLGGFEPAPDGPLLDELGASPAVYALGLRSPFRGTRDSRGFYWIADVGRDDFEEINVVQSALQNFGWPDREGPCDDCGESTPPAFYWTHDRAAAYAADDPLLEATSGRVAWVGPEVQPHDPDRYRGLLAGSVLFGDYCAGFLRQGRVDEQGAPIVDAPLGHLNNTAAIRQHADGYLYALTFGRCQSDVDNAADEGQSRLYRMVAKE